MADLVARMAETLCQSIGHECGCWFWFFFSSCHSLSSYETSNLYINIRLCVHGHRDMHDCQK